MTVTRIELSGLNTDINARKVPPGAMGIATNVVCRKAGTIEPRPGMHQSAQYTGISNAQRVFPYDGVVTTIDDAGVEAFGIGDVVDRDAGAIKGFDGYCDATKARGNLYIASQRGLQKVTSGTDTSADWAGLLLGASYFELALDSAVSDLWLPNGESAAYKLLSVREDANEVKVLSSPSGWRAENNGSGAARAIQLTIYLNSTARAGDRIEIYRTAGYTTTVPPESYYYAGSCTLTAADISAGSFTYTDQTFQKSLGRDLYSNSGQIGRPYTPPRIAKAVAFYAGSLFAANITSEQYKRILPIVEGGDVGYNTTVTSGSPTVTLGSSIFIPYEGAAIVVGMHVYDATYFPSGARVIGVAGSTVTMDTNASASGSPQLDFNDVVQITDGTTTEVYYAKVLMLSIESSAVVFPGLTVGPSALVHAQWLSDTGNPELARDLHLREFVPGGTTLQIKATNGAARYKEPLPEFAAGYGNFDQDVQPSLLEWSYIDQPEHFATGENQAYAGDREQPILALTVLGTRLYVAKADGLYVLEGDSERSGFRLELVSEECRVMSPRHACVGADAMYAWTTRGAVAIGKAGTIEPISAQVVATKLQPFEASETTLLGGMFYADKEVHLLAKQQLEDLTRTLWLVFNTETEQWTEWTIPDVPVAGCAPGASLYGHLARFAVVTASGGDVRLWQAPTRVTVSGDEAPPEYYAADLYAGTTMPLTIFPTALGSNLYQFGYTPATLAVPMAIGDMVISPGNGWKGVITAVEDGFGGAKDVTFYSRDTIPASDIPQVLYGFQVEMKLRAISSDDPLAWRHWLEAHWKMEGPMSLYKVRVAMDSSNGYAGSEPIVHQRARNFPTYTDPNDLAPYQHGFEPRYLFSRKHASATSVMPILMIREAGAIWSLTAIAIEESRGSHATHRNRT